MDNKKEHFEETVVNKLKEAKSLDELKEIAAKEGYELSDEQLEGIAGGISCPRDYSCITQTIKPGPAII